MKASKLIKELQEMQEKYGDLSVKLHVDNWSGGEDEDIDCVVIKWPANKELSYFKVEW